MTKVLRNEKLVKSRQRVADHGEVFTPSWLVEDMLDLVQHETERIDSRFLEPACGSGNFIVPVLQRKLASVQAKYSKSVFERRHYALLALMSIYGIELLADNVAECRANLVEVFDEFIAGDRADGIEEWHLAAEAVVAVNIVHGDALALTTNDNSPIVFPEWGYLGKGKFQRRDFSFQALTQRSSIEGTLFELLDEADVFKPLTSYEPMDVKEIAR